MHAIEESVLKGVVSQSRDDDLFSNLHSPNLQFDERVLQSYGITSVIRRRNLVERCINATSKERQTCPTWSMGKEWAIFALSHTQDLVAIDSCCAFFAPLGMTWCHGWMNEWTKARIITQSSVIETHIIQYPYRTHVPMVGTLTYICRNWSQWHGDQFLPQQLVNNFDDTTNAALAGCTIWVSQCRTPPVVDSFILWVRL